MIECMRNAACEHMTLDEQISFCEEKSKNIKLKAKPQTFVDIKNGIEKTERIERCGMSAGMNLEEAKIVADKMTYADAVCNAVNSKCVPYRKATGIKLKELLKIAKSVDEAKSKGCNEISTALYYDGFNDGYSKALDDLLNSIPDCDYVGIEHLVCLVEQLKRGEENDG